MRTNYRQEQKKARAGNDKNSCPRPLVSLLALFFVSSRPSLFPSLFRFPYRSLSFPLSCLAQLTRSFPSRCRLLPLLSFLLTLTSRSLFCLLSPLSFSIFVSLSLSLSFCLSLLPYVAYSVTSLSLSFSPSPFVPSDPLFSPPTLSFPAWLSTSLFFLIEQRSAQTRVDDYLPFRAHMRVRA